MWCKCLSINFSHESNSLHRCLKEKEFRIIGIGMLNNSIPPSFWQGYSPSGIICWCICPAPRPLPWFLWQFLPTLLWQLEKFGHWTEQLGPNKARMRPWKVLDSGLTIVLIKVQSVKLIVEFLVCPSVTPLNFGFGTTSASRQYNKQSERQRLSS